MPGPLHICLFTPTFYPNIGGAENAAHQVAVNLTRRNHTVSILTARQSSLRTQSPGATGPDTSEPASDNKLPYTVHYYRRPPKQHLLTGLLGRALARHCRRHRFDVVLAFYSYPTGYAATRVKHKLKVPVVISPRGEDLYDSFYSLKKPRVETIRNRGYRDADRIVAISEFIADRVREVTGEHHPPVEVAYNGIDFDHFDAALRQARLSPPPLGIDKPYVLHLARLVPIKGHETAIEAVRLARDFFRQSGLEYVIAGQGKSLDRLKELVRQYGLQDIVRFTGLRIGQEKMWLLDNASLLITASREEALGTVNIEAMAAGLPIVASDIPVHREVIEARGMGRLFATDNPQSLADVIREMLEGNLDQYKQNMREARKDFTLEKMIDVYEAACVKAVQSAGRTC